MTEPIPAKRTMHISVSPEATDEEMDRFEDVVVDAAYGFQFSPGVDAFAMSHAGNCEEDPHCGGANPWRERALKAEEENQRLRESVVELGDLIEELQERLGFPS